MKARTSATQFSGAGILSRIAVIGAMGVVTARCLFPSEDASTGSGIVAAAAAIACLALAAIDEAAIGPIRSRFALSGSLVAVGLVLAVWLSAALADYQFPGNLLAWEWTGVVALSIALGREVARRGPAPISSLVIALGLGQALLAGWQVTVDFPELRRRFERADPGVIEELAAMGIAQGTPAAESFRNRLYSSEPFGGFGHPNSLAAVLLVALVMVLGLAARPRDRSGVVMGRIIATALGSVLLAALIATKSRSAWLAGAVAAVLILGNRILSTTAKRLATAVGLVALAVSLIVGILAALGFLDRLVLAESSKSLSYRLEWWRASLEVWREAPWFGVGLGGFGDHYLRHKLPFSSEEIKDPHNFLLELACSGGVALLVAYLAVLAWALARLLTPDVKENEDEAPARLGATWWFGVTAGMAATAIVSPPGFVGAAGLASTAMGAALIGLAGPPLWKASAARHRWSAAVCLIALHIHWLAAGGVGYPTLLGILACLAAIGARKAVGSGDRLTRVGWAAVAVGSGFAVMASVFMVIGPFMAREQARQDARRSGQDAGATLARAAAHTPGDAQAWLDVAEWHKSQLATPDKLAAAKHDQAALAAIEKAEELQPRGLATPLSRARLAEQAGLKGIRASGLADAAVAYKQACERYPNSAVLQWAWGDALRRSGDSRGARICFTRALELDLTPHPDKKLTETQRRFAREFLARLSKS